MGEENGLWLGWITPVASMVAICFSISDFLEMGITVGSDVDGGGVREEMNMMLDIAGRWQCSRFFENG